jgi:predicted DCC family thiol-disulfide oxidoreductase YuxK
MIIYFDGICTLCQHSVQFMLRHDKKEQFKFASLQGVSGEAFLKTHRISGEDLDTFILQEGEHIYTRSTGALRALKHLGGIWQLMYIFIIVPKFIRDGVYGIISKNRYAWFGKMEVCWLPNPKWVNRFLP